MQPFTLGSDSGTSLVGVLVNPSGDCSPQLLTIEAWARELGADVVDLGTSAEPSGRDPGCQLVIALGGDGTILRALQLSMANHAAVLGVNFGHVGFLADIHRDDLGAALDAIGRGEAGIDERTALVTDLQTEHEQHVIAFNDVVVTRVPGFGTARLRLKVGGETLF
jgi:NAD+ kinase